MMAEVNGLYMVERTERGNVLKMYEQRVEFAAHYRRRGRTVANCDSCALTI